MSHVWMILLMTCCKLVKPQQADTQDTDILFTQYPYVQEAPDAQAPTDFLYIYPYKKDNFEPSMTNTHLHDVPYETNHIYENDEMKHKSKLQPYSVYRKFMDLMESNQQNYEMQRRTNEIKMQTNNFSDDAIRRPTNMETQPNPNDSIRPVRMMNNERDLEVKVKKNFSPWGGKRNENDKHFLLSANRERMDYKRAKILPQNLKFSAWGGKRNSNQIFKTEKFHKNKYIYTVNASKRIPFDAFRDGSFDEKRNHKLNKFHKCVGKRNNQLNQNPASNLKFQLLPPTNFRVGAGSRLRLSAPLYDASVYFPQGHWKKDGRRVETFSPWGGKRDGQETGQSQQAWMNSDPASLQAAEFEDDNTFNEFI